LWRASLKPRRTAEADPAHARAVRVSDHTGRCAEPSRRRVNPRNLATRLQDMTPPAFRNLANQRMPSIFDASNGGSILSDLTPFGIITRIWAGVLATVANADPQTSPARKTFPGLLLDFIEGLPVIGELVGLLEAIGGTYTGDDPVLLAVQEIFYPIRKLLQLDGCSGQPVGFPDH
jgi:hypothetical protein